MQKFIIIKLLLLSLAGTGVLAFFGRYGDKSEIYVPLIEYTSDQYPENPSNQSRDYGRYNGRHLLIRQLDKRHFDFILEPGDHQTARIRLHNVDLGLMATGQPEWTRQSENLEIIALTDREWNRQQVSFPAGSEQVIVDQGDGFEKASLDTVELAKNCLNAGLWEIALTRRENGEKATYYHAWFTFPMGHYKNLVEDLAGISYWKHFWRLEHWVNPQGIPLALNQLRQVVREREIRSEFLANERVLVRGEQVRKLRTLNAPNVRQWKDFYDGKHLVRFATFVPPGVYRVSQPWKNEFWRLAKYQNAIWRTVKSPAYPGIKLDELELRFADRKTGEVSKLILSGFQIENLPALAVEDYPKGLYRPMGIGVPPFYQSYAELQANPPYESPYFALLLDGQDRWLNHHDIGTDGPVLHRDLNDPNILHLYLLSYERHTLIGHFRLYLPDTEAKS